MAISPLAGKPAPKEMLVDPAKLEGEYYARTPDTGDPNQSVAFGTSGHRGSSFRGSFNEAHILAVTQAICDYRRGQGTDGPLYMGKDTLNGGVGNDTYQVNRGDGRDTISKNDCTLGSSDTFLNGAKINPLDLVLSRQSNDLRIALHGTTERVTIQNWYANPTTAQVETIQAGNGQTLLSTQLDQLIQAMAGLTAQTGLTWDQAIDQRPQDVQTVLAASWQ
jgi:hypothetical protein